MTELVGYDNGLPDLFGACFQRGFEVNFTGIDSSDEERNAYAGALAKTLYESLQPVKGGGGRPGLRSRPAR